MNHTEAIKYIKSQLKNIVNIKINYYERYICNSLNKLALCEYSIIDSLQEHNRQLSEENNECIKHLEEIFSCRLSVDLNYFNENKHLYNNLNILPIRIKKINNKFDNGNEDNSHIANIINIINIRRYDRYEFVLYETYNQL